MVAEAKRGYVEHAQEVPLHQSASLETEAALKGIVASDPYLLPYLSLSGERIVDVQPVAIELPRNPIEPLDALLKLTRAETPDEIGNHGPAMAAWAPDNAPPELQLYDEMVFGRDSMIIAHDLLRYFPQLAHTTIHYLARHQAIGALEHAGFNKSEAEHGKIMHQHIPNELKRQQFESETGWESPYYGALETTPEFINLVGGFSQRVGNTAILQEPVPSRGKLIKQAVWDAACWIARKQNASPYGFVTGKPLNPRGIERQFWRDSSDSLFHANGSLPDPQNDLAILEVQVKAQKAWEVMAMLFPEHRTTFQTKADALAWQIHRHFWVEDSHGGYYAPAIEIEQDSSVKPLKVLTSDNLFVLDSSLLEGDNPFITKRREKLIRALNSPHMQTPHGIRTVTQRALRYHPNSYHNGSSWNWQLRLGADAYHRHGYDGLAFLCDEKLVRNHLSTGVFLEKRSGDGLDDIGVPSYTVDTITPAGRRKRIIQPGQLVQGWSASSTFVAYDMVDKALDGIIQRRAKDPKKRELEESILAA